MKIEDVKVGMRVRIREWDDMEREFGVADVSIKGLSFRPWMDHLCGRTATVKAVGTYGRIELDNFSGVSGDTNWAYYAGMLEPTKAPIMPPPPDLGELHGVKLPAWFWDNDLSQMVYATAISSVFRVFCVTAHSRVGFTRNNTHLEFYTGQDILLKHSVDELKALARLV